jgi:hypothetical protein
MRILLALAVGYAIGAKGGGKDFDDLVRSIKAVCESEEFGDFVAAAWSNRSGTSSRATDGPRRGVTAARPGASPPGPRRWGR